jgi:hypothetical protein
MMVIFYMDTPLDIILGFVAYWVISSIDDMFYQSMQRNDVAVDLLHQGARLRKQPIQLH